MSNQQLHANNGEKFLEDTHLDLMHQLAIPRSFARNNREVLNMLSDDLAHNLFHHRNHDHRFRTGL